MTKVEAVLKAMAEVKRPRVEFTLPSLTVEPPPAFTQRIPRGHIALENGAPVIVTPALRSVDSLQQPPQPAQQQRLRPSFA